MDTGHIDLGESVEKPYGYLEIFFPWQVPRVSNLMTQELLLKLFPKNCPRFLRLWGSLPKEDVAECLYEENPEGGFRLSLWSSIFKKIFRKICQIFCQIWILARANYKYLQKYHLHTLVSLRYYNGLFHLCLGWFLSDISFTVFLVFSVKMTQCNIMYT